MPRGVKGTVNYVAQVQVLDEKIEKHKRQIVELTRQRQELLAKQEEAQMHELYQFMQNSGISPSQVIQQLTSQTACGSAEDVCI